MSTLIFEPKISGTRVTNFCIQPIFSKQLILLSEVQKVIKRQETMNYILDTFRFSKCNENYPNEWYAIISFDDDLKIAILENYPTYEQEMIDYFGKNWLKHYIRFNLTRIRLV